MEYTYSAIKDKLQSCGYLLLLEENQFQGTQNNVPCMNKEGYIIYTSISDIFFKIKQHNEHFCVFGSHNPYFKENIICCIQKIDTQCQVIDISVVKHKNKTRILVELKCRCGQIFRRVWEEIKTGRYGTQCPNCIKQNRGKMHHVDKRVVLQRFSDVGLTVLYPDNDFTTQTRIAVQDRDGYKGFLSCNHLTRSVTFEKFSIHHNKQYYIDNINLWLFENGSDTKVLRFDEDGKFCKPTLFCKCGCGENYETTLDSLQSGKTRCCKCSVSISRYENAVIEFLKQNKIEYIYQYSIHSCRDVLPLPFDFFINGRLIEIDGEGHYGLCYFNNMSEASARKSLEITQKHDKIKTQYCEKYNIPLLRVPYWDFTDDTYKEKIMQFIKD